MTKVKLIFERFGGASKLAHMIGQKPRTVHSWLERDSIPSKYYDAILAASIKHEIGVTADDFFEGRRSGRKQT